MNIRHQGRRAEVQIFQGFRKNSGDWSAEPIEILYNFAEEVLHPPGTFIRRTYSIVCSKTYDNPEEHSTRSDPEFTLAGARRHFKS